MLNFGNGDIEFPVPNSAARVCVECPKWKEKKNWQTNCGNAIAEIGKKIVTIVADCYCWMKKIISVLNSNLN